MDLVDHLIFEMHLVGETVGPLRKHRCLSDVYKAPIHIRYLLDPY
jgi:hypothetical protein